MTALLIEPHQDDCALFCGLTAYAEKPHVVTVLRSFVQEQRGTGITAAMREAENAAAMEILGCEHDQWSFRDDQPDWPTIADHLSRYDDHEVVYAPLVEAGGHDHHNHLGALTQEIFGDRCRFYSTYTSAGKSTTGALVEPAPGAVSAKLAALACYRTQSDLENCRPHFLRGLEEYLTP